MAVWHDIESARDNWPGAPLDDDVLTEALTVAKGEVIRYAPDLSDPEAWPDGTVGTGIPDAWRWAQVQHARNIWNASNVNPAGGYGVEGGTFTLTAFPLDWAIKQRLRPRTALGRLG